MTSGDAMDDLTALVETSGGIAALAGYLDVPPETLQIALAARSGGRTDGVARMVAENTLKLIQMPSQGGFIWRITRRRVVKDWLILVRRSAAVGGQPAPDEAEPEARELTDDQKRLLTGLARLGPDALAESIEPDELTQMAWEAGAPRQLTDGEISRLAAAAEEETEPEEPSRDIDYWPDIDLDAAWTRIAEFWSGVYEDAGGAKYYPGWLVRRQVAFNVVQAAVESRPGLDAELGEAYASVGLTEENPYEEDGEADERLEALLEAYHLRQIVDALVQSLNAAGSEAC